MSNVTFTPPLDLLMTPAFDPGRASTDLLFMHSTDGPSNSQQADYQSTLTCFSNVAFQASSHLVAGPDKATRMVNDDDTSWGETYDNKRSLAIELAMPASLLDVIDFTDFQYHVAAQYAAGAYKIFGIPIKRVLTETERGIIGHRDSEQGKSWGKVDPGIRFRYDYLIALANAYLNLPSGELTDAQKAVVLDDLNVMWGFSNLDVLTAHPDDASRCLRERLIAAKLILPQTASIIQHQDTIWGFSDSATIKADPSAAQKAIRERIVAIKGEVGLN